MIEDNYIPLDDMTDDKFKNKFRHDDEFKNEFKFPKYI